MSVGPIAPTPGSASLGHVGAAAASPTTGGGQGAALTLPPVTAAIEPPSPAEASLNSALAAIIGEDLSAQDGLAPLLADLSAALDSPGLPDAARSTAEQILQLLTPIDAEVTGEGLKAAVSQSGLFLEAAVAAAVLAPGQSAGADLGQDLKALLLRLPADLAEAGQSAAIAAAPTALGLSHEAQRRYGERPPPPVSGGPTLGQPATGAVVDADTDPASLRHTLRHDAQAALARLELMQLASLPKSGAPSRWAFELPVASHEGTGVAQFEISRDGQGTAAIGDGEPVWKARFSLNLDEAGPVHAEVALSHGRTRVTLWAEGEGLRQDLDLGRSDLTAALAGEAGLDAAVRVLAGAPARPVAAAGQLINRTS